MTTPAEILEFWFAEPTETTDDARAKLDRWFGAGDSYDALVATRFGDAVIEAIAGGFREWEDEPRSCLALIVLIDQFSRNVFRGTPKMFEGDERALQLSVSALDRGFDVGLSFEEQLFLGLPILHAEDVALQHRNEAYTERICLAAGPEHAPLADAVLRQSRKYTEIIQRFGRFPHRNPILGRESTSEEEAFLGTWTSPRVTRERD
jgi:uncharacterized protein (DUF924 family)